MRRRSVLVQDELASVLVGAPQHPGLQGCCPVMAWSLSSALPSQDLGAVWERVGLEQLLMFSQDRGEVLWQAVSCRALLSCDCPSRSWLSTQLHMTMS